MVAGLFSLLLQMHCLGFISTSEAHAFSAENQAKGAPSAPGVVKAGTAKSTGSVHEALEAYDRAFQARNVDALQQILATDIVMYEQGTKNIGRDDVLTNHLEPELRTFQEMTANFTDVRVLESEGMALITRQFSIRGKRQDRPFSIRGSETQGWIMREGGWRLTHIHLSFPPSR
jgi:ketosteroid isomerase-like protein